MNTKIFQHLNPIWLDKANFIIGANVSPLTKSPNEEVWEQFWVQKLNGAHFTICCIPIFAYGLALGDEVETDQNLMIIKITRRSGFETIRIWFSERAEDFIRDSVMEKINEHQCLIEWYSSNLLGVSADNSTVTDSLLKTLDHYIIGEFINLEIANR